MAVQGTLVYEAAEGLGGPPIWLGLLAHTTLVFTIFINVYYTRCIVSIWYVDSLGPTLPRRAAVCLELAAVTRGHSTALRGVKRAWEATGTK